MSSLAGQGGNRYQLDKNRQIGDSLEIERSFYGADGETLSEMEQEEERGGIHG
jgi:hypothetical protein